MRNANHTTSQKTGQDTNQKSSQNTSQDSRWNMSQDTNHTTGRRPTSTHRRRHGRRGAPGGPTGSQPLDRVDELFARFGISATEVFSGDHHACPVCADGADGEPHTTGRPASRRAA